MKRADMTPGRGVSSPVVLGEGWRSGKEVAYRA